MDDDQASDAALAADRDPHDINDDHALRLRKAAVGAAVAGTAFAILFVASMLILTRAPSARATDDEIIAFYEGSDPRLLVLAGLYLLPLAAVAFLWFVAILRDWESGSVRRMSRILSNVQLLSSIGFITLAFASAAASAVVAFVDELNFAPLEPSVARQFPLYGVALLYVFAMRMAAIFVTSTAGIVRASGIFPRWFVAVSFTVALVLFLAASLNVWLVLVFPGWVLLLSALIALRRRSFHRLPDSA